MAIDPDVQVIIDGLQEEIDILKAAAGPVEHPAIKTLNDGDSIQNAVDTLPPMGGIINLGPGKYDVGSGLNIPKSKRVEIKGSMRAVHYQWQSTIPSDFPGSVIYSSANPSELIGIGLNTNDVNNYYGSVFRDLHFHLNGGTTAAIRADDWNMGFIENCGAAHHGWQTTPNAYFVECNNTGRLGSGAADTSWHQIVGNRIWGLGLYNGITNSPQGLNNNQHVLLRNMCFGKGRSEAFVQCNAAKGWTIGFNNFEGGNSAIHFGDPIGGLNTSASNLLIGNSGESVNDWITGNYIYGSTFIDLGVRLTPLDIEKLVNIGPNSSHNIFIMSAITEGLANLYTINAYQNQGANNKLITGNSEKTN
jgi:hypothetical protein